MKTKIGFLILALSCLGSNSFAATAYIGKASWQKTAGIGLNRLVFSDLEVLGVKRSAEEDGLQKCAAAGNVSCAITNASIVSCNENIPGDGGSPSEVHIGCIATATVISLSN